MDKVELVEIPGKGRGLRTKQSLKIGELILKEDPYACVVMNANSKATCHWCLNFAAFGMQGTKMSKCSGCNYARYCDRDCQKKAWKEHKCECKAVRCVHPGLPSDKTKMVAQMLWKKLRGEKETGLVKIKDLSTHVSDLDEEKQKDLDDHVYDFGDYFGYDDLPENDEDLRHLFAAIDCNAIGINDSRGVQVLAVALYPTCSMMNHDCDPSAVAVNNGKILEVRALKEMQVGDEITISYVDGASTKKERQERLRKTYFFDCCCKFCTEGSKYDELKEAMLSPDISEKSINYIIGFSNNCLKRIEQSKRKGDWERMSNQVLGCLLQQDSLMADTHSLKRAVLNHGVEVHSYLQQQGRAVEQAKRVAEAYKQLYPPIHPVLGLWLMRLGVLQWQCEMLDDSLANLKLATTILQKTHGEDHTVFRDSLGLIQQVQVEKTLPKHSRKNARIAKLRTGHNLPQAF